MSASANTNIAALGPLAGEPLVDVEDLQLSVETRPLGGLLLAASLVLIAFNIRIVFSSLSTVLPEIMRTNGLSSTQASILTTVPVLCMGLFSFAAPGLAQRYGAERIILACMAVLTLGTGLRGLEATPALFAAAILTGGSIAMINVLLPGLVKRDFPGYSAIMTGLYTMALCCGAASAAAFTVPIEKAFDGSWPKALASWGLPALVVTLLWLPQALAARPLRQNRRFVVHGLTRDRLAWQITLFMGLQSALAYIVFGWLAPMLRERGLDSVTAGLALSVSVLSQMVACLVAPSIAVRFRDQKAINLLMGLIAAASFLACFYLPLGTIWIWVALLGGAQGALLSLAMTAIILRARDVHVAARLSSMAQGIGYTLATIGPLFAGILRNWTGDFQASVLLFATIATFAGWNGWAAGRTGHVNAYAEMKSPEQGK